MRRRTDPEPPRNNHYDHDDNNNNRPAPPHGVSADKPRHPPPKPPPCTGLSHIAQGMMISHAARDLPVHLPAVPLVEGGARINPQPLGGVADRLTAVKAQTDQELLLFRAECENAVQVLAERVAPHNREEGWPLAIRDGISERARQQVNIEDLTLQIQIFEKLCALADHVRTLSYETLCNATDHVLDPILIEIQQLRSSSSNIVWAVVRGNENEMSVSSPVMRLVLVVSKLSRITEQIGPSDGHRADSPLSSIYDYNSDLDSAAYSQVALRSEPKCPSNLGQSVADSQDFLNSSPQDARSTTSAATGEKVQALTTLVDDRLQVSDTRNESCDSLRSTQSSQMTLASRSSATAVSSSSSVVMSVLSIQRAGRRPNTALDPSAVDIAHSHDHLLCRICEERHTVLHFDEHSKLCLNLAIIGQRLAHCERSILGLAGKLEAKTHRKRADGTQRSEKEKQLMREVSSLCRVKSKDLPGDVLSQEEFDTLLGRIEAIRVIAVAEKYGSLTSACVRSKAKLLTMSKAYAVLSKSNQEDPQASKTKMRSTGRGSWRPRELPSKSGFRMNTLPTMADFNAIKPISKGAFGKVYLARKSKTGDIFAIKVLQKSDMIRKNLVSRVQVERDILAGVSSPFIVRFFWSFHTVNKLFLVMEFLPGGDMYSLLCNLGFLDDKVAKQYLTEVVLALEYLHSIGICHRDLKPENLLISQTGHLKLTDFGLSRLGVLDNTPMAETIAPATPATPGPVETAADSSMGATAARSIHSDTQTVCVDDDVCESAKESTGLRKDTVFGVRTCSQGSAKEMVGTPDYLAPELLLGSGHGYAVDWWALGVIMYEFLMGIPPFHDSTPENIFENILNQSMEWPVVPDEMSEEACDLIRKLLEPDPALRLGSHGVNEIKEHEYFAGTDWGKVHDQVADFIPENLTVEDTSYFQQSGELPFSDSQDLQKELESEHSTTAASLEAFREFPFQNLYNLGVRNEEVLRDYLEQAETKP